MKNLLKQKCDLQKVTRQNSYKVVGIKFIKSSRTSFVSIKASIVQFLLKNVIKKFSRKLTLKTLETARCIIFSHQNGKFWCQSVARFSYFFLKISMIAAVPQSKQRSKTINFSFNLFVKVFTLIPKQYLTAQKNFFFNSNQCFIFFKDSINRTGVIIQCGDVETNPGPIRDK